MHSKDSPGVTARFTSRLSWIGLSDPSLTLVGMRMPQDVPALVERFPRIVEVVTVNEAERLAGRERFKAYRDLGHELHNFDQSKS